jgi:hypothetical protein
MINKKNVLGKAPFDLGDKDAIHVAIVAVRAGRLIKPGEKCGLNEHREAVPDPKGVGVADPFLKDNISTGDSFWLLLNQDAVPNVRHVWEHPTADFTPPSRAVETNRWLQKAADGLGVTYSQLMQACASVVSTGSAAVYPGTLSRDDLDDKLDNWRYEVWSEWASESGYEFDNHGSECCPEYDYPEVLFKLPEEK